ncbi:MAG: hypothetical protein OEV97_16315, partial [Betaproteobacteria bacterium]|nr:hypothetical protein [Betaproteobacteria bacterium]
GFSVSRPPTYFIVQSNFETEDPGWRFWEWFRADRMKDFGADKVFPGPNDLVVDTRSMSEFAAAAPAGVAPSMPASRRHDFGTTAVVHHTNYFEQKGTWDFILDKFGVQ